MGCLYDSTKNEVMADPADIDYDDKNDQINIGNVGNTLSLELGFAKASISAFDCSLSTLQLNITTTW